METSQSTTTQDIIPIKGLKELNYKRLWNKIYICIKYIDKNILVINLDEYTKGLTH